MIIITSDEVPGREIGETLGLVTADAMRARHIRSDVLAALKNIVGGEIGAYRQLLMESRAAALTRLTRALRGGRLPATIPINNVALIEETPGRREVVFEARLRSG